MNHLLSFSHTLLFQQKQAWVLRTILFIAGIFFSSLGIQAQPDAPKLREKVGVLYIDTKGFTLDAAQMGQLTRLELDKLGIYEVLDKYDVDYIAEKEQLKLDNCFGKICLVEVGKKLGADKMLTGSVELISEKIIISMRLIDVATQSVERSQVVEYLNLKPQIQVMVGVTLRKMLALPVDDNTFNKLTRTDEYESSLNNPDVDRLNLNGPRMGATIFTGEQARRLRAPNNEGGADAIPIMFQFGYQFETSYLNQGGLQALFEFIPIVTGLDQGLIIPSITVLHGLRSNRSGLEFAFGPSVSISTVAEGLYVDGKWLRTTDWWAANPDATIAPSTIKRYDSRGKATAVSTFVFAFGKSFKSGRMNIPVNVFVIPNKSGTRFGLSVGFNGRG